MTRRRKLVVVSADGNRGPFLRGMITHAVVQRGVEFDTAYAVARSIRDRLAERDEVSTSEIRDLIEEELTAVFGETLPAHLVARPVHPTELWVLYHGERHPFSRGVLARSLHAAGLDLDRTYLIVMELEKTLRGEGVGELGSDEIVRRVGDLLEKLEGPETARRYRLVRRIHRLPRPLVIYFGGATGTGKSTLALELAPLLRIYRINSTDTIRQVMRMVFSPVILPAVHGSSFEPLYGPGAGLEASDDPEAISRRVLASFEEQSIKIAVGVRAVVERAIVEQMSTLIEGVHLFPPHIPFADLEGAVYQVPILLSTLNAEAHRDRFQIRARLGGRLAERYLESFGAIRTIQELLLERAEAHDVALLDTSMNDAPVIGCLRLLTSLLERRVPGLAKRRLEPRKPAAPTLLLIIDGVADRPVRALGGRTPLQAARLPTLDRLALEGRSGVADPVAPGVVPDTAAGSLAVFGQSPLAMKRGPVEALGAGFRLSPQDIALRGNLATIDDLGRIVDRRAGRIRDEVEELAAALDLLPLPGALDAKVSVRVRAATEHRLAIVLQGEQLSSAIHGSDPGEGVVPGKPLIPRPIDPQDERAVLTAGALTLFEEEARRVLATHPVNLRRQESGLPLANTVITRGAGRLHRLLSLEDAGIPLRLTCVAGDRTILGLAGWLGADCITAPGMTANLDTDLPAKFGRALEALERRDLVVVHVKGADIAAHDQRPDLKVQFLERVDRQLGELLAAHTGPLRVVVASDHATLSESGQHAADPLPVVLWGAGVEPDAVTAYDEQSAAAGALQRFPLQILMSRLFDLS